MESYFPEKFDIAIMKGKNVSNRDLFWRTKNSKAVRDGDWKYIEIITGTNMDIEQYLFNLKNDRYEQNNQYSKFPDKVLLFQKKLAQWEKSVDSEIPEQTK